MCRKRMWFCIEMGELEGRMCPSRDLARAVPIRYVIVFLLDLLDSRQLGLSIKLTWADMA